MGTSAGPRALLLQTPRLELAADGIGTGCELGYCGAAAALTHARRAERDQSTMTGIWIGLNDRPVRNAPAGHRQHCRCRTSSLSWRLNTRSLRLFILESDDPSNSLVLLALLGTRSLRTHPFAPYGRQRPGKTAVRTALSPRYLIRMKSEVQLLPGPPFGL